MASYLLYQVSLLLLLAALSTAQVLGNETALLPKPTSLVGDQSRFGSVASPPADSLARLANRVVFFVSIKPCGFLFMTDGAFSHNSTTGAVSNGTTLLGPHCWDDVQLKTSVNAPGELFFFGKRVINGTVQPVELFSTDGSSVDPIPFADPVTYAGFTNYPFDSLKFFGNFIGMIAPASVASQAIPEVLFVDLNVTRASRSIAFNSGFTVPLSTLKPKLSVATGRAMWVLFEDKVSVGVGQWWKALATPNGLSVLGTPTLSFPTGSPSFYAAGDSYLTWLQPTNNVGVPGEAQLAYLKESDTTMVPLVSNSNGTTNFTWVTLPGLTFNDRILAMDEGVTAVLPAVYYAVNSSGFSKVVRTRLLTGNTEFFLHPFADSGALIGHSVFVSAGTTLSYFSDVASSIANVTYLTAAAGDNVPFSPRSVRTLISAEVLKSSIVFFIGSPVPGSSRLYRMDTTTTPWQVRRTADVNVTSAQFYQFNEQLFFMCTPPSVGFPTLCKWNDTGSEMSIVANFTATPSSFDGDIYEIFASFPPAAFVVFRAAETNNAYIPFLSFLARPTFTANSTSMASALGAMGGSDTTLAEFVKESCDSLNSNSSISGAADLFGLMADAVDQFVEDFTTGATKTLVNDWAPLMTSLESLAQNPQQLQNKTRFQLVKILRLVALNRTNQIEGAQQVFVNITDRIFKIASQDPELAVEITFFLRNFSKRLTVDTNATASCSSSLNLNSASDLAMFTTKTSVQDLQQNGRTLRSIAFQLTSDATSKLTASCLLSSLVFYSRFPINASLDDPSQLKGKGVNSDQPALTLDLTDPSSGNAFFKDVQDTEVISLRFNVSTSGKTPLCVFFNTTTQTWSSVGGRLVTPARDGEVECAWKHLTDFSVLLPDSGSSSSSNKKVLLGAAIGASLAAVVVVAIIVTAIVFRKKLNRVISFGQNSHNDKEAINTL